MRDLTEEERIIYNEGERLIPGITHSIEEVVRHQSSYVFFKKVIELDRKLNRDTKQIRILDLGCGVGHGCKTLSKISHSEIVGVDVSHAPIEYARRFYSARNIKYKIMGIDELVTSQEEYDYIVSRGVIEHIPNGINLVSKTRWRKRLIFDVPYEEPAGINPHHLISNINEDSFSNLQNVELFYQGTDGVTYNSLPQEKPNMIMCVSTCSGLPPIADQISFPMPAWKPSDKARWGERINRLLRRAYI